MPLNKYGFLVSNWVVLFYRTDWRLTFVNLKEKVASNVLDQKDRRKLWFPSLVFENNPSLEYVKNKHLAVFKVQREGHPEERFNFKMNEHLEYKGSENPIFYENIYEMKLACEMELHFYPFDTQRCFIRVKTFPSFRIRFLYYKLITLNNSLNRMPAY